MDKKEIDRRIGLFKERVLFYQKELNLLNWEISVFEQIKQGVRASCYWTIFSHQASICYSKDWIRQEELDDQRIDRTTFHECCELLYCKIQDGLKDLFCDSYVDELIHSHIRLWESILYPILYKNRKW